EAYGTKAPESSARLRKVLSTPKKRSASGASLLRMILLSASPASPSVRICTRALCSVSNWRSTSSPMAKESCVATVSVAGCGAASWEGATGTAWQPASATTASSKIGRIRRRFMIASRNKNGSTESVKPAKWGAQIVLQDFGPYAGITQIRFSGSAAKVATLSAQHSELPVVLNANDANTCTGARQTQAPGAGSGGGSGGTAPSAGGGMRRRLGHQRRRVGSSAEADVPSPANSAAIWS